MNIETLKQEIKAELLEEMRKTSQLSRIRIPWDDIREEILQRTRHLDTYEQHQVLMALSALVRHALGIRMTRFIRFDQQEAVKQFVQNVLDGMERLSENKGGDSAKTG